MKALTVNKVNKNNTIKIFYEIYVYTRVRNSREYINIQGIRKKFVDIVAKQMSAKGVFLWREQKKMLNGIYANE